MKYIIIILVVFASLGLIWSAVSFINSNKLENKVSDSVDDYTQAVNSEASDICQTPTGYSNEEWLEHMSHHPDRYKDCFKDGQFNPPLAYQDINPKELSQMLKVKNFTLIDVHIPEQDHIPGTDALIPYNEIVSKLADLPQDKKATIVLYCRSGNMSQTASKALIKEGYTNVYNLAGGLKAWQSEGYEVEEMLLN